jgi:predicted amidophosphoribosyltransferase
MIEQLLVAISLTILIMLIVVFLHKCIDNILYNHGICKKCHSKLQLTFQDSQGNYCYYCTNCAKPQGLGWRH